MEARLITWSGLDDAAAIVFAMPSFKQRAKRAFRDLIAATGYEFQVYRRPAGGKSASYELDFTPRAVFDYFPSWDSRIVIDGVEYGGVANRYANAAGSMLNDSRVTDLVSLVGKSVLELGPLEGGNTALLKSLGAGRILAIEGRAENFVKCCAVAQLLKLEDVHFRLGDLRDAKFDTVGTFDIAFASGVLYHLDNPHIAVANMATVTNTMLVSTHVVNEDRESHRPMGVLATEKGDYRGQWVVEGSIDNIGAGLQTRSFKPFAEELVRLVRDFGFVDITDLGIVKRDNSQWSSRLIARR